MREITCFHLYLTVKMYLKFDIFSWWLDFSLSFFSGAYPHYTKKYFLLGSEQISRMTLKISKTAMKDGEHNTIQMTRSPLIEKRHIIFSLAPDEFKKKACRFH